MEFPTTEPRPDRVAGFSKGKAKSARDCASSFRVHVPEDLARVPANEIDSDQIADMVRRVREAGKERPAGILRSYLRAAYGVAIRARFDSGLPVDLKGFNVSLNPVDAVPAIAVRAGERVLSHDELREYLGHLGDGIIDQALKLALLSGGQRMAQLLRIKAGDWDDGILRLQDGKGRRVTAREHLLPVGPRAAEIVDGLVTRARVKAVSNANPSLFLSTDRHGEPATVAESTPGKRVVEIARAMGGEPFDLRDIRRTVETQMARLGVSRDIRAQLLSHGISGVQAVHYNRHDYIDEKRAALVAWEGFLFAAEESNVVPMRRGARA